MIGIFILQKYNPSFFDDIGRYKKNEWTDVSGIGKIFDGQILSKDEYIRVENAYLECLNHIMDRCDIQKLQVRADSPTIEGYPNFSKYFLDLPPSEIVNFDSGTWIEREDITRFLRLALRGFPGYGLTNRKNFFIWSTFDYYVRLGFDETITIDMQKIRGLGLFLVKR